MIVTVALILQIVDREQELMSTAGLQTIGGGGGLGRGGLDRQLRIVPSKQSHKLLWQPYVVKSCLASSELYPAVAHVAHQE